MTNYPDDADGAVLADLSSRGIDMLKPLKIEFPVAVPNEASAKKCSAAMFNSGYTTTQIVYDEGEPDFNPAVDDKDEFGPSWTVYTEVEMIPEYKEIVRIQKQLDQITAPHAGRSDGWGVMLDT